MGLLRLRLGNTGRIASNIHDCHPAYEMPKTYKTTCEASGIAFFRLRKSKRGSRTITEGQVCDKHFIPAVIKVELAIDEKLKNLIEKPRNALEVEAMENNYPQLPKGPVICERCANEGKGHKIVMQKFSSNSPEATSTTSEEFSQLQSYRCPSCEHVAVFRVF